MKRTKKELSGKEKRLKFVREMKDRRNRMKQKSNLNYPGKAKK